MKLYSIGCKSRRMDLHRTIRRGTQHHSPAPRAHGLSLVDAVASDRGSLFVAARSVAGDREITTDRAQEALVLLVKVWAERAARLAGTGEDAVCIAAFERAVGGCPLPEETTRALWTSFIDACEAIGNRSDSSVERRRALCAGFSLPCRTVLTSNSHLHRHARVLSPLVWARDGHERGRVGRLREPLGGGPGAL